MSSNRRSSLGMLLRRSKSGDLGKGGRKPKQSQEQQREVIPSSPPRLPVLYNGSPAPELQSFGGDARPDSVAIVSGNLEPASARPSMEPGYRAVAPPVPPIPPSGGYVDPYARTESMTHRGRYSYASSAISTINSPRRVRRRKDPTPFNILVIGTRGSGKTSFLEFLKTALALPPKKHVKQSELDEMPVRVPQGNFIPHYLETEIDNERVGLTIWDSEGLEKNVVDLQLREMSAFLESKFEETFAEEMKVIRSPGVQDTHIHAVFLILDPARLDRNISAAKAGSANGHTNGSKYQPHHQTRIVGGLDEDLDLQVLRTLQGKTTVIPVISKADTITSKHMAVLKKTVCDSLKKAKLDPLEVLGLDDEDSASNMSGRIDEVDEEAESANEDPESLPIQGQEPEGEVKAPSKRQSRSSMESKEPEEEEDPYLPMSIISPDIYEPEVVGRQFPWGFADPYNEDHCDFVRLKDAVFSEWRGELREASREQWYEGWRTSRLKQRDGSKLRR